MCMNLLNFDALLPTYLPNKGNVCILYDSTKKTIIETNFNYFLHSQYKFAKENQYYYSNLFSRILKHKKNLPHYINGSVYIPIKIRKPLIKTDSASGIVKLDCISKVNNSSITLKSGVAINYSMNLKTLNTHYKEGLLIKNIMETEKVKNLTKEHSLNEQFLAYYLKRLLDN